MDANGDGYGNIVYNLNRRYKMQIGGSSGNDECIELFDKRDKTGGGE